VHLSVFHVKPGSWSTDIFEPWRELGSRDEHLCTTRQQVPQYPSLMATVEFGRKIVQGDHRPLPLGQRMVFRLRQQRSERNQLRLAPGQRLPTGQGGEPQRPIRPMRADRSMAGEEIAFAGH